MLIEQIIDVITSGTRDQVSLSWDHMAKRRVKLLVSKVIVDSSQSFYSPHLPTVRLPTSYLPLCLFDKPPRKFLYPPTHSTMRLLVRNRGGLLGVSHWLPHRPFAQISRQSYYLAASSFPTSTIPVPSLRLLILFTYNLILYSTKIQYRLYIATQAGSYGPRQLPALACHVQGRQQQTTSSSTSSTSSTTDNQTTTTTATIGSTTTMAPPPPQA